LVLSDRDAYRVARHRLPPSLHEARHTFASRGMDFSGFYAGSLVPLEAGLIVRLGCRAGRSDRILTGGRYRG
jgi:hypothetical protein